HKGAPVSEFRRRHSRWIFHRFPGYAPDLNPDEFVWTNLKGAVANSAPKDNADLKRLIHAPLMRLRQSQRLLWSCIYASDLPWG
ncbi:MAG: transposase, partial [Elusimicrobia bacterium]|nr:transposase [Elusimicrobiota bacterium]